MKNKKFIVGAHIFLVSILVLSSFSGGLYLAKNNDFFNNVAEKQNLAINNVVYRGDLSKARKLDQKINFDLFWQTWDQLKKEYVDSGKLTDETMFYGALKGLAESTGDPYTVFMDPKETTDFADFFSGTFEGIGAEIGLRNGLVTIIAPLTGMPAEKAGLRSGDRISAINGKTAIGLTVDAAVKQIRGAKGTQVKLTILRNGQDKPLDITITRGTIIVKSVKTELRKDNIFVITVSAFSDDTEELFNKAVKEALLKKPTAIILDLRNNPGGYLETSIAMAGYWTGAQNVVSEKSGTGEQKDHKSASKNLLKDYKTVVLVNQGSASASEIVSGALQDYKLATIIGKKTFGKGSVQQVNPLSNGASLKITIAKWFTPNGRSINEEGVMPDVQVDMTEKDFETEKDPQLDKAVNILLGKEKVDDKAIETETTKK